ncbi:MAG: phage tail sheath family protein [Symploca sp. SIO1B1]|nr:phage tail sheath family protein [Symploca sp. SIO1B1]
MPTYKTPNVYVEEISTLPPSVAEVSTAIPAFIGYTEKAVKGTTDLTNQPTRISSMLDYETWFGGAPDSISGITSITNPTPEPPLKFLMYYALRLYFDNGGGSCYIVSVGKYKDEDKKNVVKSQDNFQKGLDELKKEDEPTLIMLTDATTLSATDYYTLCQKALMQCGELKDRFTVIDLVKKPTDDTKSKDDVEYFRNFSLPDENLLYGAAYYPYLQTSLKYKYTDEQLKTVLDNVKTDEEKKQLKANIDKLSVVLPPSAAIAGVYARVDNRRGVWKAPANEGLLSVIGPVVKITNEEQENLNIDPTAGKSINAIRSFTGKGTLVWGARTLAGNDNEWRYISVRRLFNLIEESIQKATMFAVFEANTALTWLKVRTMIESYLEGLWRQGAFAGATAEQAYFVNVGLGQTMTEQDVLEGRMIIEIGVAAVRPAEFIILKFSHKLQEA